MKIISIWDSRFASEYNFEFRLVELNHSLFTFAKKYEKFDDNPLVLQDWMQSIDTPKYLGKLFSKNKKILSYISRKNYFRNVKRNIKRIKPDIVICNFGQIGSEFVNFCNRNTIPLVVLFYGHDISAAIKSKRWQRKYRAFKEISGTLIVLCEEAKRRLINLGCKPKDIVIWNLPIVFDFPIAETSVSSKIRLVTAGRFIEKKGYPILFQALSKVRELEKNFEIEIFGYGPDFTKIKMLAERQGLEKNIIWRDGLGGSAFKVEFLKSLDNADLFLLCAVAASNGDDEGGPSLSLVIAQAKGVPVVTTNFPGHELSVLHGKTGFIAEGDVFTDMAKYISEYSDRHSFYREIGLTGAEMARSEFDYIKQVDEFAIILNATIEKYKV